MFPFLGNHILKYPQVFPNRPKISCPTLPPKKNLIAFTHLILSLMYTKMGEKRLKYLCNHLFAPHNSLEFKLYVFQDKKVNTFYA